MAKKTTKKPIVLLILDGFGLPPKDSSCSAISKETAPHIFSYLKKYPSTTLTAHGLAVGLPKGQSGNSEAGHLTIGSGRAVMQDATVVDMAIENGTFAKNLAFKQTLAYAKKHTSTVHLMGLLTNSDSAHARPGHLYALLDLCRAHRIKHVYLHLFTDGRDARPHAAIQYLKKLEKHMPAHAQIASMMGRYYAMDRDKNWELTQQAYNAIANGKGTCVATSPEAALNQAYNRGETDEFVCPTVITSKDKPIATVRDNDVIIFFNTRSDRARQLTKAFVQNNFLRDNPQAFRRGARAKNVQFCALSEFGPDLGGVYTAFPSSVVENTLSEVLSPKYSQFFCAETEKRAHTTYFFNGGRATTFENTKHTYIPSYKAPYAKKHAPMQARAIVTETIHAIKKGTDVCVVNLLNADMMGHTGDIALAKKSISYMDTQINRLAQTVLTHQGYILLTADHGNAESMCDMKTGEMLTAHSTASVPCILISSNSRITLRKRGTSLADIAPTILDLLDEQIPDEMTGKSLLAKRLTK